MTQMRAETTCDDVADVTLVSALASGTGVAVRLLLFSSPPFAELLRPGIGLMTINKGNFCLLGSRANFPYCHSVF